MKSEFEKGLETALSNEFEGWFDRYQWEGREEDLKHHLYQMIGDKKEFIAGYVSILEMEE